MALDQRTGGDELWRGSKATTRSKREKAAPERCCVQGGGKGTGTERRRGCFVRVASRSARTAPKPHLSRCCFACVRERAVRISPAAKPLPLWGLLAASPSPASPAACLPATAPRCRSTEQLDFWCEFPTKRVVLHARFGRHFEGTFFPASAASGLARFPRVYCAFWVLGVGNVAAAPSDGLCVKKEASLHWPSCTCTGWHSVVQWASAESGRGISCFWGGEGG